MNLNIMNGMMSDIHLQKQVVVVSHREFCFYLFILLLTIQSSTVAVTLTGSSEYAVPGSDFTLTCDVPEEAKSVQLYRRPDVTAVQGSIHVRGGQCYNTATTLLCSPDVCSCTTTQTDYGTVFQWVIQPHTGDHGSVWYCQRTNARLPATDRVVHSPDYTLNVADGPGTVTLFPSNTTYIRTEGDTLPDITCTADCRPSCTFVWTKLDNTNFTTSAVLSLGQLDRSEHGTYRCTARNVVRELTTTVIVSVMYAVTLNGSSEYAVPDNRFTLTCDVPGEGSVVQLYRRPDVTAVQGSIEVRDGQCYNDIPTTPVLCSPDVCSCTTTSTNYGTVFQWVIQPQTGDHGSVWSCRRLNRSLPKPYRIVNSPDYTLNVACKPRPYLVPDDHHTVDIPLSKTLTIPAVFISNPEPLFTWTFQLNQLTAAKELVNGTDNFAIQNNFEKANVSALSVGIRTNIQEEWFGLYHVTATNSQGSAIVSFTVRAQRNPSPTKMLSVDCGKQISAKVSWKDGGNSQFYRVLFSMDAFEHSEEVYPLTIAFEEGRNIYNLNVDNLVGGRLYTFKIAAYNTYGNTTSLDTVGCTVQEECSCSTDNMYVTAVALICTSVLTLLLTVGLGIFISRNGRLPFIKGQHLKQSEFQNVQLSERAVTPNEEEDERSPYEQLDTNEIAKASVYSEIESHLPGRRRDPVNDNREYESLEGRSNPNVYEDLHGTTSGEKEIYINTAIADGGSGSGN
ncbi:uncharacterized protein LOC110458766 [Mizuhopecten yessoensis]|uniref:uncharacterized protein LOC110458766 n=1 Tax=Mizuhopecten yessoensis TaxID=6573 RepID=UPI000B45F044|nr:uncharacterized protein LOC110458766 [Mizuhopecten yessoensis]